MSQWYVEVWYQSQHVGTYPVEPHGLTIGRSPDSHLRLSDPSVSRHHAFLRVDGGRLLLRDVGSKSGTFVNDRLVRGDVVVRVGDVIRIGPYTMKVLHQSPHVSNQAKLGVLSVVASGYDREVTKACPRCGTQNPERARYCMQCGEPLVTDAVAGSSQRTEVPRGTVVEQEESEWVRKPVLRAQPFPERTSTPPRSFWGGAILVFLFYLLGITWPIAVIVNWIIYSSAKREEELTGQSPPGKGCLGFQLFLFFWVPLMLGLIVAALIIGGSGALIFDILRELGIG